MASLKSSMISLCRPDLTVGTAAIELGNPNAVGVMGSPGGSGQMWVLSCQRQSIIGVVTIMDSRVKTTIRVL